jgi:hypothetical protein
MLVQRSIAVFRAPSWESAVHVACATRHSKLLGKRRWVHVSDHLRRPPKTYRLV